MRTVNHQVQNRCQTLQDCPSQVALGGLLDVRIALPGLADHTLDALEALVGTMSSAAVGAARDAADSWVRHLPQEPGGRIGGDGGSRAAVASVADAVQAALAAQGMS